MELEITDYIETRSYVEEDWYPKDFKLVSNWNRIKLFSDIILLLIVNLDRKETNRKYQDKNQ